MQETLLQTIIEKGPRHEGMPGFFVLRADNGLKSSIGHAAIKTGFHSREAEKLFAGTTFSTGAALAERIPRNSPIHHALAFSMATEKLSGAELSQSISAARTAACELERIANHLESAGECANAAGCETAVKWAARDREFISDLLELLSGNRTGRGYIRPGGVSALPDDSWKEKCAELVRFIRSVVDEYRILLDFNPVFKMTAASVARVSAQLAEECGLSGCNLRACGKTKDTRTTGYAFYGTAKFDIPHRDDGSALGRTSLRLAEIPESLAIIEQALPAIEPGKNPVISLSDAAGKTAEACVESPQGDLQYEVRSAPGRKYAEVKIKTPSLPSIVALEKTLPGIKKEDFVIAAASFNIDFREADL